MSMIVMLQMMASMTSEKEAVDDVIEALQKYKEAGYPEDRQPFSKLTVLLIKWQQGDITMKEAIMEGLKHDEMINKIMEKEKKPPVIIPLSGKGEA